MAHNNFKILAHMAANDMDIACSVNQVTEARQVKAGAKVTVGIGAEYGRKIIKQAVGGPQYHVLLFVVNAEQYEAVAEKLEGALPSARCPTTSEGYEG